MTDLRQILGDPECVGQARGVLEQVLAAGECKPFDEAVELRYTFPLEVVTSGRCSDGTRRGTPCPSRVPRQLLWRPPTRSPSTRSRASPRCRTGRSSTRCRRRMPYDKLSEPGTP